MSNHHRWTPDHGINGELNMHWDYQCQWRKCAKEGRQHTNVNLPFCHEHLRAVEDVIANVDAIRDAQAKATAAAARARMEASITMLESGQQLKTGAPKPGWLYFIQMEDLIKIGYTTDLYSRLRHYPPNAIVLAIQPGTMKMEKALHGQFRFALAKGREWFHVRPEITDHIAGVVATYGEPPDYLQDRYRDANRPHNVIARRGWSGGRAA